MGKAAVIFPGQGAQSVGMGRDLAERSERAAKLFARANEVLDFDIRGSCFDGPAESLERTDIQQPAIFLTGMAIWEALLERGVDLGRFSAAAGLSLGEYTALTVTGAVAFEDALRLVHRRGRLMQEAAAAVPSGMVSLIGATEESAVELCARAAEQEVLAPANFNCPGQIVISGAKGACERAVELAGEFGCRGVALPVSGAFHSAIMQPAADQLGVALGETEFKVPQVPVVSNVTAAPHTDPGSIRRLLQDQVVKPVRWQASIERLIGEGVEEFVEIGPGRVLTGLMRKINRKVPTVNVSKADHLEAVTLETST
ncbi:MAG: ACP S-malonyltransferase [bacterium]|nr:ACP S-malonyltransferase [bacterium]